MTKPRSFRIPPTISESATFIWQPYVSMYTLLEVTKGNLMGRMLL